MARPRAPRSFLPALAAVAVAVQPVTAQPDYNHDCASTFADSLAFMSDFAAGRPAADLNLDGRIDQNDFDAFADSRAKPEFGFYWQVSTTLEPGSAMDTRTNLQGVTISRNSVMIYEQEFPKIPIRYEDGGRVVPVESGFHLMFRGLDGGYSTWRPCYDAWMAEHTASLPAVLAPKVPSPLFDGLLCIDWETVMPLYRIQVRNEATLAAWDGMIEAINSPLLDTTFLQFAEWTAPAGATRWADLSADQRRDLARAAHLKVGLDFFVRTAEAVRLLRPRAKIHYYGMPQGYWPFYDAERSGWNDQLAPLWRAVDVLSPSLYQLYWTTTDPASSPCPEAVNTPAANSVFFKALLDEMYRLKQAYPRAGQVIIPYAWWHYKGQAGRCSPEFSPTLLVNDTNLLHQLRLPWWYGADAVAIWGHYARNGEVSPDYIGEDIQARWRGPINALSCPR
jgi:hypothetical protein